MSNKDVTDDDEFDGDYSVRVFHSVDKIVLIFFNFIYDINDICY